MKGRNLGIHSKVRILINLQRCAAWTILREARCWAVQTHWEASDHLIKLITIALNTMTTMPWRIFCVDHGIVVSQGHSGATYEQALMAVTAQWCDVDEPMFIMEWRNSITVNQDWLVRHSGCGCLWRTALYDGNHSTYEAINNFLSGERPELCDHGHGSLMVKSLQQEPEFLFGGNEIELMPDGSAHLVVLKSLAGSTLKVNQAWRFWKKLACPGFPPSIPAPSTLQPCLASMTV